MNMHQAGQFVTLAGVTLNGDYKITNGNLQPLTITNARGTAAGWAVIGQVTDFKTTGAPASCDTAATYDRLSPRQTGRRRARRHESGKRKDHRCTQGH